MQISDTFASHASIAWVDSQGSNICERSCGSQQRYRYAGWSAVGYCCSGCQLCHGNSISRARLWIPDRWRIHQRIRGGLGSARIGYRTRFSERGDDSAGRYSNNHRSVHYTGRFQGCFFQYNRHLWTKCTHPNQAPGKGTSCRRYGHISKHSHRVDWRRVLFKCDFRTGFADFKRGHQHYISI